MSETVNLPALGESVTEGTVTRWLKAVGDRVEVDEPLVEVSTDKVDTEVPSPVAGVIEEIFVGEDEEAEVGSPLVRIGDGSSGSNDEGSAEETAEEESAAEETPAEEPEADEAPESDSEKATESPKEDSSSASGDATEITLPALGESVTEGTVTRWLKEVGDDVAVDEPLLEVSTDKVDTEVPSPAAGTLLEIKVGEDETAEVGSVLALIGSGASSTDEAPKQEAPKEEAPQNEAPKEDKSEAEQKPSQDSAADTSEEKPAEAPQREDKPAAKQENSPSAETPSADGYVTPLVRKLANQNDIDLSTVKGTGVGGRIRKQDVEEAISAKKSSAASTPAAAAAPKSAAPAAEASSLRGTTVKAPRIRQVIASRMRESLDVSTQLTQVQEVDMTRVAKLRSSAKANFKAVNGTNLTFLPFIAKAVTEALKQHPKLNAEYDEQKQEITYHGSEHLAIAVDTEKGLLVPVIQDAGDLNMAGLAGKIADVAARTRDGKIGPDELSGGTFSITNIGSVGALFDTPIINQPQVAILGTGAIVKRPVVVTNDEGDDTIAIRHMMYLSLTYDHRLVDGADAGRFLQTLKARLEGGAFEGELGL
ncbi:2-oxoglutarate dehydrogenase, E2 component, dihydrolipoamide succinyltransferase [Zhihengliuella flava]|uniref:Dihydrolipoamide acetyltransferase component of pyruvate dehydrogenase complex n=1 Tax=Zhihengliuella flava TaxID=1285193 RepID=A0A931DBR5_9MICC|nr:2-oxoglutarate dehydrogenase, E2 component, dihydrolipoamide succinyltransferase [Zhihengliuella flava]MBG6085663.1 2-oxoglutarate dehydrogenase E2 component (dihydrolipoamide succinyltransferase) [Zhihengliuella flava]